MVLKKIYFVDVEETTIGLSQKPRLEGLFPEGQRALEIERTDDAVLGRAQRQIDDGNRARRRFGRRCEGPSPTSVAKARHPTRITIIGTALHDAHLRQQSRKCANGGRFARASITKDQHPAD